MATAQGGNEVYSNSIMGGDHPDASPISVGADFYLTHSSFEWAPGLLIWHSLDLANGAFWYELIQKRGGVGIGVFLRIQRINYLESTQMAPWGSLN